MIQSIIAKANLSDKVIDFRDCLNLASVEDYAMMHGTGGEKHTRSSVIKLTICDYSKGTGDASTTVSANISPVLCEKLFEVCKRNLGDMVIPADLPPFAIQRDIKKIANMQFEVLQYVIKLSDSIASAANHQVPGIGAIAGALSKMLSKAKDHVLAKTDNPPPFMAIPNHCDITHIQDRIHSSKQGDDGFAPVQRLTIMHRTYRKDGSLSQYPWSVKVTNGRAKVRTSDNGATTFDPNTLRDSSEAFIMISDDDMYRCLDRVVRYIDAWEKLNCLPLIKSGLAQKQAEFEAYKNSKQKGV